MLAAAAVGLVCVACAVADGCCVGRMVANGIVPGRSMMHVLRLRVPSCWIYGRIGSMYRFSSVQRRACGSLSGREERDEMREGTAPETGIRSALRRFAKGASAECGGARLPPRCLVEDHFAHRTNGNRNVRQPSAPRCTGGTLQFPIT